MAFSNFPAGFMNGVTVRGVPILQTHPGKIFWVYNGTTIDEGHINGSNGNRGTFNQPFATVTYAISQCRNGKGDVVIVKPGHAETISSSTAHAWAKSGVAIVGLGVGDNRPTLTWDTAATSTITVSAADVSIQNFKFVANFLSITAAFTLTTAKNFTVQNCEFRDTSNVLDFLAWVKSTGAANTVDGLTFTDNNVYGLGTTSVTSVIVTANDVDRLTYQRNYVKLGLTNDKAIHLTVTAGVLTSLLFTDNIGYRLNTTTAGGGSINVGGTTSTGVVARNFQQTATTSSDLLFTTTVGLGAFENRVSGAVGATGFVIPAVDS